MNPFSQQALLPLSFEVTVAGTRQRCTVLKDLGSEEIFDKYLVRFQDGTEAIFTVMSHEDCHADQPGLQSYADALNIDLFTLQIVEPGEFFHILSYPLEGEETNFWLIQQEPDQGELESYHVRYNLRSRFEIYLDGSDDYQWRSLGLPALTDEEVAIAEDLLQTIRRMRGPLDQLIK
jgi:hypothetical protein